MSHSKPEVTVVGAGPTGALMSLLLARRGYHVRVFEYRQDPRKEGAAAKAPTNELAGTSALAKVADAAKRSINLTLSHRGLEALKRVGLDEAALRLAVPVLTIYQRLLDGALAAAVAQLRIICLSPATMSSATAEACEDAGALLGAWLWAWWRGEE